MSLPSLESSGLPGIQFIAGWKGQLSVVVASTIEKQVNSRWWSFKQTRSERSSWGKDQPIWVFVVLDVWSRLWPSTVIEGRSQRNTLALFRDVSKRMNLDQIPMITSDGFKFCERVVAGAFGPGCLYGQVLKTRRNDRIMKVEQRIVLGGAWRLKQALQDSEGSVKLNTSFVERLNLRIRQGSAYLGRRTTCQVRWKERLEDHLELLRCHYNFVRPHRALKFGREVRTPAMQAGLAKRRVSFRDIFSTSPLFWFSGRIRFVFTYCSRSVHAHDLRFSKAA
jgi:IS1 family transposase